MMPAREIPKDGEYVEYDIKSQAIAEKGKSKDELHDAQVCGRST